MPSPKKSKQKNTASPAVGKTTLIVSDDPRPAVSLLPGQKLQVLSVSIVTPDLKKRRPVAARLCGGTNTCIALIEV